MRFKSLLALLLLSSVLAAQNCDIFDLSATIQYPTPPTSNCQYFVKINFGSTGTTNQFTITGNGNNYGTFAYGQQPVTLGPFTAPPNNSQREFVVRDLILQDCFESKVIDVPACAAGACEITQVNVDPGDCNPSGLTYSLALQVQVNNASGQLLEIWAGNGTFLGVFPILQQPIQIPAFPWSGNNFDVIKVCVQGNPDCCKTIEFDPPNCLFVVPCNINDLSVIPDTCTSDSTYRVKVNFNLANGQSVDSFQLYANGNLYGTFATNQLPLSINDFPWNGGFFDVVKVCATIPATGQSCCASKEVAVPDCLSPCGLYNLTLVTDSCSTDSTFRLKIDFDTNPFANLSTFKVWANNGIYLGEFNLADLPIQMDSFPWNGNVFQQIRICVANVPGCCIEKVFPAPACLPFAACEIKDIFTQIGTCTSDSTYKVRIGFQASNPGNGTFTLTVNNQVQGTYPLTAIPLFIDSLQWGGGNVDVIKICINPDSNTTTACCRSKDIAAPDCLQGGPCEIYDLTVTPGDCNPNAANTYPITIDFEVQNPGNQLFEVFTGAGQPLGTFPLSQLPLTIPFPASGNANDVVKICINDQQNCCKVKEFPSPCPQQGPCEIYDLTVTPGDCDPNGQQFQITIDFEVQNPGSQSFTVYNLNGQSLGSFPLSQLPVTINYPGTTGGAIKVCINDQPNCCKIKQFSSPCQSTPCEIFNLAVQAGDCLPGDSSYMLTIDFDVQNPGNQFFEVFTGSGQPLGTFPLSQLPITIPFPASGNPFDAVKVCINDQPNCCKVKEFQAPTCQGAPCEISNLSVQTGDCTSDSTYQLWVNFNVSNTIGNLFGVWANGSFLGAFNLNQLPLQIPNFPYNGGQNDVIKVCMLDLNSTPPVCCATLEFPVPACILQQGPCEIYNLVVETGDCTGDSTYVVHIDFDVANPPANTFGVWANGIFQGIFNLNQLPLTIQNFPWNGGANDLVKICFVPDPSNGAVTCCKFKEFPVPACLTQGGPCSISGLVVETGDCTGDSTYQIWINFQVSNPPGNQFAVWGNNQLIGVFNLSQLPLSIPNFAWNGGNFDVVKVCFGNGGIATCCAIKEFQVPDCLQNGGGPCEIYNLVAETGDCTSNTTYQLTIDFDVNNAPSDEFVVFANGTLLGAYNLNQLPLTIAQFPWNGGTNDVVKVCFQSSNSTATCCAVKEFQVPDCLNSDCHIWDVAVQKTPCLCGQFFAIITFNHDNGGPGGFDIGGNGTNYGNFPYNTPQPIILGPLDGDGTTSYEFIVRDHLSPDCKDAAELGVVLCTNFAGSPADNGKLVVSPNPATDWLQVTAQLPNGIKPGASRVEIYHADGRLVQQQTLADGASFQLYISNLPAGMYRMVLQTEAGLLEGKFAKQ
jgi:hypothetical protein